MASPTDPVWREGRLKNENEAAPGLSMAAQAALRGLIGNDIGPPSPEEARLQNYVNTNSDPQGRPSPQILAQFQTATGGQPPLGEVSGMPAGQPLPMPPAPGQIMPPAPQPQAPGAPQIQHDPRIAALEQERQRALAGTQARAEPWQRERESAFTDLQQAGGELGAVRPPRLEGLPTYHPAPVDPDQFTNFGAAATVFASLAGLLTRQPLTAALNAAGRAMQGYTSGRFAQIDNDLKVFRTEFDSAMARNRQSIEEYNAILSDKKLNFATREAVLKAAAAGQGDEITRGLLQVGKIDDFIKLLDARDRSENTLRMQYENINQHLQAAQMRYGQGAAGGGFNPETMTRMAEQYLAGDQSVLRGLGIGAAGMAARQALMNEVTRLDIERGLGGGAGIAANAATRTALISVNRNLETYVARTEALLGKVDLDIGNLMKVADQGVGPSGVPAFDKWVQQGRRAAGDPTLTSFDVALQTVKNEYARIMSGPMSNAQLHVSAMTHADELINGAMNIDQLKAGVGMMRADMQNAYTSYGGELGKLQSRMRSLGTGGAAGGGGAPAPYTGGPYSDPGKEQRYQEWKRSQGR